MDIKVDLLVLRDMTRDFKKSLKDLQSKEVLVGFPEEEQGRKDESGNPTPITNAGLGYIHNTGSPEANIPARPFMVEGVESVQSKIIDHMKDAARAAVDGDSQRIDQDLQAVGLVAQAGIRNAITEGEGFEPLAESTLKARARRGRQGAKDELDRRAAGEDAGTELARPLVDTGQLRAAVNFAIREK